MHSIARLAFILMPGIFLHVPLLRFAPETDSKNDRAPYPRR